MIETFLFAKYNLCYFRIYIIRFILLLCICKMSYWYDTYSKVTFFEPYKLKYHAPKYFSTEWWRCLVSFSEIPCTDLKKADNGKNSKYEECHVTGPGVWLWRIYGPFK